MPSLYNCKHSGDQYRVTKFDSDFNVESSYLCDLHSCDCPAGVRPSCRHRQMLPKFIQRDHIGDEFFFDFDRGGWVQGSHIEEPALTIAHEITLPDDASPEDVANAFGNLITPQALPIQQEFSLGGFPDWCLSSGECTTHNDCIMYGCVKGHGTPPRNMTLAPAGLGQVSEPIAKEQELIPIEPSPSPSPTIRRRV